jgi:hypothetical protein
MRRPPFSLLQTRTPFPPSIRSRTSLNRFGLCMWCTSNVETEFGNPPPLCLWLVDVFEYEKCMRQRNSYLHRFLDYACEIKLFYTGLRENKAKMLKKDASLHTDKARCSERDNLSGRSLYFRRFIAVLLFFSFLFFSCGRSTGRYNRNLFVNSVPSWISAEVSSPAPAIFTDSSLVGPRFSLIIRRSDSEFD